MFKENNGFKFRKHATYIRCIWNLDQTRLQLEYHWPEHHYTTLNLSQIYSVRCFIVFFVYLFSDCYFSLYPASCLKSNLCESSTKQVAICFYVCSVWLSFTSALSFAHSSVNPVSAQSSSSCLLSSSSSSSLSLFYKLAWMRWREYTLWCLRTIVDTIFSTTRINTMIFKSIW